MPVRFSPLQIALHWTVALLVLAQYLNDDAIGRAWRATLREGATTLGPAAWAHILAGIAILALAVWRLVLRARRPAQPLPADEPALLRHAARATHALLYALLILLPLSGLAAFYGGVRAAGAAHEVMKTLLILLVALHVAGALFQQFVLRSGALSRMVGLRI